VIEAEVSSSLRQVQPHACQQSRTSWQHDGSANRGRRGSGPSQPPWPPWCGEKALCRWPPRAIVVVRVDGETPRRNGVQAHDGARMQPVGVNQSGPPQFEVRQHPGRGVLQRRIRRRRPARTSTGTPVHPSASRRISASPGRSVHWAAVGRRHRDPGPGAASVQRPPARQGRRRTARPTRVPNSRTCRHTIVGHLRPLWMSA
jgi:hypothetical protein